MQPGDGSTDTLTTLAGIPAEAVWLRPAGLLRGAAARSAIRDGSALALAGLPIAFALVELLALREKRLVAATVPLAAARRWAEGQGAAMQARLSLQLVRLSEARPRWAGLALDRPLIMGVLNVTPDSFSDGGDFIDPGRAVAAGRAMIEAGADIIDIGGESTRPGSAPVPPEAETRRVAPVIEALAGAGALISIDTRHAAVMEAALAKGARIVNDVSALTSEPGSCAIVARSDAAVVLMHMRGEPRTMQDNPAYDNAPLDIATYLAERIAACGAAGIAPTRIVIDPGIGFGKHKVHNLELIDRIALFHGLGCGILLGVSRKSLIGAFTNAAPPKERLPGSLAGALYGLSQGVQILRVHDVAATRQAIAIWQGIAEAT